MSYHVYPVVQNDNQCTDYIVKINGQQVETNVARVSAVPFNRRWPGHQREIEQTELIQFVSLEMNEAIDVEVIPTCSWEEITIRPIECGIEYKKTEENGVKFRLEKPSYFVVEAYGRNRALHFFADPDSDYQINKEDENVIYFGAGEHDVGMLHLESNQIVFIDEGAVVYACIHAIDADNIRILGRGILDNSRNKENYADVHDITYENISVEFEYEIPAPRLQTKDGEAYWNHDPDGRPPLIQSEVMYHPEYSAGGGRRGKNHKLIFHNVRLYGRQTPWVSMKGYNHDHKTSDVVIADLYWNGKKVAKLSPEQICIDEFCENIYFRRKFK